VIDSESLRFILNQTEVLGPKVNFHWNSRTKNRLSSSSLFRRVIGLPFFIGALSFTLLSRFLFTLRLGFYQSPV
jgi:hypothetical protein